MKSGKLDIKTYRRVSDEFFKGDWPKKNLTEEEFNRQIESYPKSEIFGITVRYALDVAMLEDPDILEPTKAKVGQTFERCRSSKFDFLHNFNELILHMSPLTPLFDENFKYIGIGTKTYALRLDSRRLAVFIGSDYLVKRREGVAFNGILSHELLELQYVEQNESLIRSLPESKICHDVLEVAADERVYAIDPRYCVEMQQISFDEYFKRGIKGTDIVTLGIIAPLAYLALVKHKDPAGKKLRKRVLDSIRNKDPRSEILALRYERALSEIPLYSPRREDYINTVKSMRDLL
jgi:hypothetical protein